MPYWVQITNYIKYKRKLDGDGDNLDEIINQLNFFSYNENKKEDDLLTFGEK
jgi:hypothetical protein